MDWDWKKVPENLFESDKSSLAMPSLSPRVRYMVHPKEYNAIETAVLGDIGDAIAY